MRERVERKIETKRQRKKTINKAIRIAYKTVKDPLEGRPPEKTLPKTVIIKR